MNKLHISIFLFSILIIGFIRVRSKYNQTKQKESFTQEFLGKLHVYISSRGSNLAAYTYLIMHSNKMQDYLGILGICNYRPPFANHIHRNYPIILNLLPELNRCFQDNSLAGTNFTFQHDIANYNISTLQEVLLRYLGELNEKTNEDHRLLKNPIIWFREGVQMILILPIQLLNWLGIVSIPVFKKISQSFVVKILSSIIVLMGIFSSVIEITLGWNEFIAWVKYTFGI